MSDAAARVGDLVDGFFGLLNDVAGGSSRRAAPGPAHAGGAWATGSAECCVCPVCRAIAAVRDPSPETVFKAATGAGDIATGAAGMLRGFSSLAGSVLGERPRRRPSGAGAARHAPSPEARHAPSPDQAWAAATRGAAATQGTAATGGSGTTGGTAATGGSGATGGTAATGGSGTTGGTAATGGTATGGAEPGPGRSAAADPAADPWAAATAESARQAAAARDRARAAERAVARAVADARRAEREAAAKERAAAVPERDRPAGPDGDVWSVVTSEAAAGGAGAGRSVDHERGAAAPEDRGVVPGDDARGGGAV
ncbi:hypothetical protein [Actinoplanes siamensis]|uniref:hypothetical protein n=1 Tax=Actinoplanes siamensis TaxID=1223317 RepID=UPI0019448253|nr:hypothetical protein [Actinoplanes siamensis]